MNALPQFDGDARVANVPPPGFSAKEDGIYIERTDADETACEEWLCSPIEVISRGCNAEGTGWTKRICVVDSAGQRHFRLVPEARLAGSAARVISELRDMGLDLASGSAARKHLLRLLNDWKPLERFRTTNRLGWTGPTCPAFVLGNKRVLGASGYLFCNEAMADGAPEMRPSGDLTAWRETVAAACVGNPVLTFAASVAFAGPLLELLGLEGGGLHLRGVSSSGKTTALSVANSVWGSPGNMQTWRTTANALEGIAAIYNGSLLTLDELGQVSAKDAGDAAYALANGRGKNRSTSTGMLQQSLSWKLLFLSTGEISLAEKLAESGKKTMAGQEVRFIDIAADTRRHGVFDELHGLPAGSAFANHLKMETARHYGTAGPAFVELLLRWYAKRDKLKDILATIANHIGARFNFRSDGQVERVLSRFALVALAGSMATKGGLTGWPELAAIESAVTLFGQWVENRGDPALNEVLSAVARVRDHLRTHGSTRYERIGGAPIPDCLGYRDDDSYYISGETWARIHCGFSGQQAAKHLLADGFLIRGDGNNMMYRLPGSVVGRPRAYRVRATILDPDASASSTEQSPPS